MTSLTQLSQAIHDAPQWHLAEAFQHPNEIQIIPLKDQALGAVVTGLEHVKHSQAKPFSVLNKP